MPLQRAYTVYSLERVRATGGSFLESQQKVSCIDSKSDKAQSTNTFTTSKYLLV